MVTPLALFAETIEEFHALETERIRRSALPEELKEVLLEGDIRRREELWRHALGSALAPDDRPPLFAEALTPYYVGFGNPQAPILFVGQELAFDFASRPDLLFHENLSNLVYWREILARGLLDQPNQAHRVLPFSPLFPNAFHRVSRPGHTWGIYARLLAPLVGTGGVGPQSLLEEFEDLHRSLFAHCFMTELYDRPAKRHEASRLSVRRERLLASEYYRQFPVMVIGSAGARNDPSLVERLFDLSYTGELPRTGRIPVSVFASARRRAFVTWQLSGTNRPSSQFLSVLSSVMGESLPRDSAKAG